MIECPQGVIVSIENVFYFWTWYWTVSNGSCCFLNWYFWVKFSCDHSFLKCIINWPSYLWVLIYRSATMEIFRKKSSRKFQIPKQICHTHTNYLCNFHMCIYNSLEFTWIRYYKQSSCVHMLYENTGPFYLRDLNIPTFWECAGKSWNQSPYTSQILQDSYIH